VISAASKLLSRLPPWAGEALRFLIVGGLNTAVSYACYLILLHWLAYEAAYAISYVIGVLLSYVMSALFVFRQPLRLRTALRFPLVYLVQFLLGFVLLKVLVELIHVPEWLAPLIVTIVSIPVTFLLSRLIVRST
jgi:putative flippase GtrA